jgi:hypothetical protein
MTDRSTALVAAVAWRTSSYSANNNDCVEVATGTNVAGFRDSKRRSGPTLIVRGDTFTAFLNAIRADQL